MCPGLRQATKEDFNPYLSVNANLQLKNGVIGQYTYFPSGIESQKPYVGFRIFGTKGEIYLEEKSCGIINIVSITSCKVIYVDEPQPEETIPYIDGSDAERMYIQ